MASETTPELEALVLGLFEVGAVKVRASLSSAARLRASTSTAWVLGEREAVGAPPPLPLPLPRSNPRGDTLRERWWWG